MRGGPFNFYQYQGTGAGQFIAPFSTSFTGIYFPLDAIQGLKIPLIEDDTLRPVSLFQIVSGFLDQELTDKPALVFSFSGNVYPSPPDSGNYAFQSTGEVLQDNIDKSYFSTSFSGSQSGINTDKQNLIINCTGFQEAGLNLSGKYYVDISGEFITTLTDKPLFIIGFSGGVQKGNVDSLSFDATLSTFVYQTGLAIIKVAYNNTGDYINPIDLSVSNIIYRFGI